MKHTHLHTRLLALLLCCALVLPLSACGEAKSTTQQIFAMDTVMDLTAYGKKADDGINAAISIINSMDKLLDPENERSKTYEINHAMGSPVVVNEQIAKMLRTAQTVYERTNGAFDLTTYPLSKLWGFIDQNYRVPSDAEIERLLPCVDMSKVQLAATDDSANSLVTMPADMALSFGAVAKGCASDYAIQAMRAAGVTSGVVSLGGNVQTLGKKPDGSDWNIAIQDPNDTGSYLGYLTVGEGLAFKYLYAYELTGEVAEGGEDYLAELDIQELPERMTLPETGWDGAPIHVTDDGISYLELGPEANSVLAGIGFSLFYVDEETDQMLLLGTDNDMNADWDNGVFYDNFRGVWGALDGNLVYMELSFDGEDYNLYSVPILLNGEAYNLQVAYEFDTEEWSILGATQGLDPSGMASKERRLLKEGDVVTTIWKLATLSGDDEFEMYAADEVTVTADTAFGEAPLFDGTYAMVIEMRDPAGNYAYSDAVSFECVDGQVTSTTCLLYTSPSPRD